MITLDSDAVDTIREALELAENAGYGNCLDCCQPVNEDHEGHGDNCAIAAALDELMSAEG